MAATALGKRKGVNSKNPSLKKKNNFFTKKAKVPQKSDLLSDSDDMDGDLEHKSDSSGDILLEGDDSGSEMSSDGDDSLGDDFLKRSDDEGDSVLKSSSGSDSDSDSDEGDIEVWAKALEKKAAKEEDAENEMITNIKKGDDNADEDKEDEFRSLKKKQTDLLIFRSLQPPNLQLRRPNAIEYISETNSVSYTKRVLQALQLPLESLHARRVELDGPTLTHLVVKRGMPVPSLNKPEPRGGRGRPRSRVSNRAEWSELVRPKCLTLNAPNKEAH